MATTALAKPAAGDNLSAILKAAEPELRRLAPKYVRVDRMIALAIEAKLRNPLLANCSPVSVVNFCKKCAEVGTDRVGAGGMWPVPFRNSKTGCFDMVPIPDWRLLIEKAKKAKAITHATADVVYEKDVFRYQRGTDPLLMHQPALTDPGKPIATYCVYALPDGTKDFLVMSWAEVVSIRDRSKAWQNYLKDKSKTCPWVTDECEMAKKTVVKRTMKLFEGASIELTALLEADNVVNGLEVIDIPAPIEMPKALPAPAPAAPPEPQGPPQDDVPPEDAEQPPSQMGEDSNVVTGTIETVSVKTGTSKKGTPWTKYGVKLGGVYYGTFDTEVGEAAKALHEAGATVRITWEADGEYRNLLGLARVTEGGE